MMNPTNISNPYERLGIRQNASWQEIEKAYREMAVKWHPDRHRGQYKEFAREQFKAVQEAHEILSKSAGSMHQNKQNDASDFAYKKPSSSYSDSYRKQQEAEVTGTGLNGFIYVPSINIYVAKERTLYGKDWNQCHEELGKQGLRMPTLHEFFSFIDYLKTSYQNRKEAEAILDDVLKAEKWGAEWLDAYFENGLIYTHNKSKKEKLENCIKEDEDSYVELEFNRQGLPISRSSNQRYIQGKNIRYWSVITGIGEKNNRHWMFMDGRVATFGTELAGEDFASLYCHSDPEYAAPIIGVRPCTKGAEKN
jgi:curved DNA-binding protein CbpA